jgi:catechol 2,3-dioxygenase-like lactoylglutathione lyase family enzyme
MTTAPSLDFVVFYVSDLTASLAYFTDVLGFTHVPEEDEPGFHFLTGAGGISFGLARAGGQAPDAGAARLYIKTADLRGRRDAILGKGVEATPIEQRPFGAIFTVHTLDGCPLIMMEPPAAGA